MSQDSAEALAAVRAQVSDSCRELLSPSPSGLDRSAALLESAVRGLRNLKQSTVPQSVELLKEAQSLRVSLRHARRMLESAASFHQGWLERMGALCAGYTDAGTPARVDRTGRFLARG
jgi:hypothetical protein